MKSKVRMFLMLILSAVFTGGGAFCAAASAAEKKVEILDTNFQPNGAFNTEFEMDWSSETMVMVLDLSKCTESDEQNLFTIGKKADKLGGYPEANSSGSVSNLICTYKPKDNDRLWFYILTTTKTESGTTTSCDKKAVSLSHITDKSNVLIEVSKKLGVKLQGVRTQVAGNWIQHVMNAEDGKYSIASEQVSGLTVGDYTLNCGTTTALYRHTFRVDAIHDALIKTHDGTEEVEVVKGFTANGTGFTHNVTIADGKKLRAVISGVSKLTKSTDLFAVGSDISNFGSGLHLVYNPDDQCIDVHNNNSDWIIWEDFKVDDKVVIELSKEYGLTIDEAPINNIASDALSGYFGSEVQFGSNVSDKYSTATYDSVYVVDKEYHVGRIVKEDVYNTCSAQTGVTVELQRSFPVGWNGVCFPFDVSLTTAQTIFGSGIKIRKYNKSVVNDADNTVTMYFDRPDPVELKAGKPYLIYMPKPVVNPVFSNVDIPELTQTTAPIVDADGDGLFVGHGLYQPTDLSGIENVGYINDGGEFAYGQTKGIAMGIYFTSGKKYEGYTITTDYQSTVITGIEEVKADSRVADNRVYNIMGQYVGNDIDALPRGIYIVNGEKIVK